MVIPDTADAAAPAKPTTLRTEQRAQTMVTFRQLARCESGSPDWHRLRDQLVAEHMNYARYVAARFDAPPGAAEDLAQVAYLALVKSVDNFDPEYGTAFIGYLTPMITGEIKRYFRDSTWDVHVPRRMQELSLELRGATEVLFHRLGRSPTVAELSDHVNASPEDVVNAMEASGAYSAGSLDRPSISGDDSSAPLGELIGDEDKSFDMVVDREALKPLLARLSARDKQILLMRFFRNMTQSQIGEELGVSQMQVSRLLTRILGELREGLDEES